VHYYDSMSGSGKRWVDGIMRWIRDEAKVRVKRAKRGATAFCIRPSHGVSPRPLLLPVPCALLVLLLQDKKGIADYSTDDWQTFDREVHVPQQGNGVDCGVFTCICADFTSEDLPLRYSQDDMLFFREKICADILRGNLTYPV
jgi:hypothetical protein